MGTICSTLVNKVSKFQIIGKYLETKNKNVYKSFDPGSCWHGPGRVCPSQTPNKSWLFHRRVCLWRCRHFDSWMAQHPSLRGGLPNFLPGYHRLPVFHLL